MTAALVLALRDEGKLALDDLLQRHLPVLPSARSPSASCSGTPAVCSGSRTATGGSAPRADVDTFLSTLTADKVAYPPLHGYHYSNLAYGLLGAMVARVGGEDWQALLAKRLLGPLQLDRTTYSPTEPFARGYVVHPWLDELREEPRHDAAAMAPAGQLWSTVEDLARWAGVPDRARPGGLAPATVAEMCAPVVVSDLDGWTAGHGLGLQLWRRGERVFVGHSGSMPGYLAILAVHRPSRTGVVAFGNAYTDAPRRWPQRFRPDLLGAVLDRSRRGWRRGGRARSRRRRSRRSPAGGGGWARSTRSAGPTGSCVVTPLTTGRRRGGSRPTGRPRTCGEGDPGTTTANCCGWCATATAGWSRWTSRRSCCHAIRGRPALDVLA